MLAPAAAAHALAIVLAAQRLGVGFDARVQTSSPPALAPGAEGELSVTILDTPAPGLPLSVRLRSTRVVLAGNRLDMQDVVDPLAAQPRVRARFRAPAQPGAYEVGGLVEYVTCDAEHCRPRRVWVAWVVEVVAPEPTVETP